LLKKKQVLGPIVLEIVGDVHHDSISPVCFNEGSRELIIENHHLARNTIWRQSDIVNCQPILLISFRLHINYFNDSSCVRGSRVIIGIYIVHPPFRAIDLISTSIMSGFNGLTRRRSLDRSNDSK
jgi:hypothetical protein